MQGLFYRYFHALFWEKMAFIEDEWILGISSFCIDTSVIMRKVTGVEPQKTLSTIL